MEWYFALTLLLGTVCALMFLGLPVAFAFFAGGCLLGWLVRDRVRRDKMQNTQASARQIIANAQQEAEYLKKTALLEARDEQTLRGVAP